MTILEDKEWSGWSDREIARKCGVTADLVVDVRKLYLSTVDRYEPEPTERLVERNGTT